MSLGEDPPWTDLDRVTELEQALEQTIYERDAARDGTLTWRCVACDEHFNLWWVAEDHVDNTPCASRLELIWPTRTCVCALHDRIRDGENPERCYRCAGTIRPQ